MEGSTAQHTPNTFLSRILQVALGLFVTTSDLPPLPANHELLSYDCSFDADCRWMSMSGTMDRWRVARGEPDSFLWLAATGTMQIPREPFVLIEQRGNPVDSLTTDLIRCQRGYADLSFTYWAIGSADLEICLIDQVGNKFNCTGMLDSRVMPGKVSLKVPEIQKAFRISIVPNNLPGVLIIDDIRYDASICETPPPLPSIRGRPDIMSTLRPVVLPWTPRRMITTTTTEPTTTEQTTEAPTTTTQTTTQTTTTQTTTEEITERPHATLPSIIIEKKGVTPLIPSTTTDIPFDLMILGNKTSPLFDRRTGMIIMESTKLLCGFNDEFACQWGAEAGKWAIIEEGAVPSLDESVMDKKLLPSYPAALVIQGTAMLTSDPVRCQSGPGKVLFRYWSNGDITLQVCALGYGIDSRVIQCVDQSRTNRHDAHNLAVFDLKDSIRESFTLNIVPQWESGLKNRFLIIDEIAYIGECNPEKGRPKPLVLKPKTSVVIAPPSTSTTTTEATTTTTTEEITTTTTEEPTTTQEEPEPETTTTEEEIEEEEPPTPGPWIAPSTTEPSIRATAKLITLPPIHPSKPFTKEPYTKRKPYPTRSMTRWTIPPRITTTVESKTEDYCEMLNCNFDDNACNYLNHGLTKKPWTLRNRGYGYPLSGNTDIRPANSNGQFVSSILDPGDIAILESPKFNATRSLNVLLFQYYRPAQMTTIRLCLGSRYTNPLRNVASFIQCPSILRSVTSKNAFRWNTVHVQLPPGTTHFFLVAHNSERAESRAAMAIDNMRVAICDSRGFAPDYMEEIVDHQEVQDYQNI